MMRSHGHRPRRAFGPRLSLVFRLSVLLGLLILGGGGCTLITDFSRPEGDGGTDNNNGNTNTNTNTNQPEHVERNPDDVPDQLQSHPAVAVAPDLTIAVAWVSGLEGQREVFIRFYDAEGNDTSPPELLSTVDFDEVGGIAMTWESQGSLRVAWTERSSGEAGRVMVVERDGIHEPKYPPLSVYDVSSTGPLDGPAIAARESGDTLVVFSAEEGVLPGDRGMYRAVLDSAGQVVQSPGLLFPSAEGEWQSQPTVARPAGTGQEVVAYRSAGGQANDIMAVALEPDTAMPLMPPVRLNHEQSGDRSDPSLLVVTGTVFVAAWWSQDAAEQSELRYRYFEGLQDPVELAERLDPDAAGDVQLTSPAAIAPLHPDAFGAVWVHISPESEYSIQGRLGMFDQSLTSPVRLDGLGRPKLSRPQIAPWGRSVEQRGFVAVWQSTDPQSGDSDVHLRLFDAQLDPVAPATP